MSIRRQFLVPNFRGFLIVFSICSAFFLYMCKCDLEINSDVSAYLSSYEISNWSTRKRGRGDSNKKGFKEGDDKAEKPITENNCNLTKGLNLTAFGNNFEFEISKKVPVFNNDTNFFKNDNKTSTNQQYATKKLKMKMFSGNLKNNNSAKIYGYCSDKEFLGKFEYMQIEYVFESLQNFVRETSDMSKILVYRTKDYVRPPCANNSSDCLTWKDELRMTFKKQPLPFGALPFNEKILQNFEASIDPSSVPEVDVKNKKCMVEIVIDYSYYIDNMKNVGKSLTKIAFTMKYASDIFEQTDFDGDGAPDGIGLRIKKVYVIKSENDKMYTWRNSSKEHMEHIMNHYHMRLQKEKYCLSILFVSIGFDSDQLGLSYVASPENIYQGGICQGPTFNGSQIIQTNTLIITNKDKSGRSLPQLITALSTAHGAGHAFGSSHDDLSDKTCSPGGEEGHYLMYPNIFSGLKSNQKLFSPCSRQRIHQILKRQGTCLTDFNKKKGRAKKPGAKDNLKEITTADENSQSKENANEDSSKKTNKDLTMELIEKLSNEPNDKDNPVENSNEDRKSKEEFED